MLEVNARKRYELARYLDINEEEIQLGAEDSNDKYVEYRTPHGTFFVMDEEESREAVYDDIENLIDDLGIYDLFTADFIDWIEDNAVDQEWFKDWFYQNYKDYARDIEDEEDDEYGNRLNQECIYYKIIKPEEIIDGEYRGEEDLYELFANYRVGEIEDNGGNFVEEFNFQLGRDSLKAVIRNENVVDLDAIVDECISLDGYGHSISRYDGKTIELDDELYAYKIDDRDERE